MRHTFIHVSDLHIRADWPEQTGFVLTKFFEDLKKNLPRYENPHIIFSGDLVHDGGNETQHASFIKQFGSNCDTIGVPYSERICIPGNHDLERSAIQDKVRSLKATYSALNSEEAFLQESRGLDSHFKQKFSKYIQTEKSFAHFGCCQSVIGGQGWALADNVGIYCLNTALCSFGGIDDPDTGKKIDDARRLHIDTSSLHSWLQNTDFKFRVLVMHHPIEFLSEWSEEELKRVCNENFQLICSGHVHKSDSSLLARNAGQVVKCSAPALFTRKSETLGYAFITLDSESDQITVDYRQWTGKNFVIGTVLAENDEGKNEFSFRRLGSSAPLPSKKNITEEILRAEFEEASMSYSSKRSVWVDRDLSDKSETQR